MRIGGVKRAILALFGLALWGGFSSEAQLLPNLEPEDACSVIRQIEVRGNRRMRADAVRFDLRIKRGDRWDDNRILGEFSRFWERGFFSDLRFLRRCEPDGAVLVVEIEERPTVLEIDYEKVREVNRQQIEDYYKERDFVLSIGSPLDKKKLWRATGLVKDVLAQKGYLDAEVSPEVTELSEGSRSIYFRIKPGGKTKIRELDFSGNDAYKDRVLRTQLKLTKEYRWWWPFSKKALYHPLKYQQDVTNVLDYYRNRGYLDVDVQPPVIEVTSIRDKRAEKKAARRARKAQRKAEKERRKRAAEAVAEGRAPVTDYQGERLPSTDVGERVKKWVYVEVPIDEGPIYHLGEITFEGNNLFDVALLRAMIPLQEGAVIVDEALEFGLERIRTLYGVRGYVYSVVSRSYKRREDQAAVADVVVSIDEDQAYTVGDIEFRGNTTTNDFVLRRELNIAEGELMNKAALDRSMQKLRVLGYWQPGEEAELAPRVDDAEVDVVIQGEEQSRNEIQVGGGYSELEGGFFLASYQTRNFLGRGETLNLYLSVGGRSNRATISFVEPWFMGKPYQFGFSLSRRAIDFYRNTVSDDEDDSLTQKSTGGSLMLGRRLGDFSSLQFRYSYESIEADTQDINSNLTESKTKIASFSPTFQYRRLDNPLRPTRGETLLIVPQITSKSLGADADYFRPRIEASFYRPIGSKLFYGINAEFAMVKTFGGDAVRIPGYIDGVPRFQRFFMGGDTIGPRVFETRSIAPERTLVSVDVNGTPVVNPTTGLPVTNRVVVGGSKMGLVQFELGYPIGRTATLAGFVDIAGVYDNGINWSWDEARVSAGLEFRVFLPIFQAPIRLIYGYPIRYDEKNDRTNRFQFSIGLPF